MTASTKAFAGAFTLVELLVSIAIVAILMAAVIAILNTATSLTVQSKKHLEADDEARMVFDRLAVDFSRLVNRTDVDYIFAKVSGASSTSGANDTFFFYSEAPALATTSTASLQNTVALIGYRINSSYQLERLGKGLVWGAAAPDGMTFLTYSSTTPPLTPLPSSTLAGASSTYVGTATDNPPYSSGAGSDFHLLGPDVFRLEFCFLLKPYKEADGKTVLPAVYSNLPYDTRALPGPAHTSPYGNGLNDVQAIVVSIAILDANSRKLVSTANLGTLAAALTDSDVPSGNLSASPPILVGQTWDSEISPANFSSALKIAVPAVRIYQRTFYLNPFLN